MRETTKPAITKHFPMIGKTTVFFSNVWIILALAAAPALAQELLVTNTVPANGSNDVDRAVGWFSRKGTFTVFFCRFIPIVRSLISIPAGISRMNMGKFFLLTGAGTVIWNFVLVYVGSLAGESWEKISDYMHVYARIALIILMVLAATLVYLFYKKRF